MSILFIGTVVALISSFISTVVALLIQVFAILGPILVAIVVIIIIPALVAAKQFFGEVFKQL